MPSCPSDAKGLLLSSIRSPDPVVFFEPKALYRAAVEEVPVGDYMVPLGKAKVTREGTDVTIVAWGNQVNVAAKAADMAAEQGISVEIIDLRTLLPWDTETVFSSVIKTGKLIITHEAPVRIIRNIGVLLLNCSLTVSITENGRICCRDFCCGD